jgi:hypothetical protein
MDLPFIKRPLPLFRIFGKVLFVNKEVEKKEKLKKIN